MRNLKRLLTVIILIGVSLMVSRHAAAQEPTADVQIALDDFGYQDQTARGMYGSVTYWVPFQSNWRFADAITVALDYTASPLLHEERSTLTVLVNDQEVSSFRPVADGTSRTHTFDISTSRLQGAGVSLRVEGYLRLTDDVCEIANDPAQWVTVHTTTTLTGSPQLNTDPLTLSDLPEAIMVQNSIDDPPPVVFVLPDDPTAQHLTVAAQVASRLGHGAGGIYPVEAAAASTLTDSQRENANLVVIGTPAEQPLINELSAALPAPQTGAGFVTADDVIAPADHGVVQLFRSPWNPAGAVLLVSAGNTEGLTLAGDAFADRLTFQSLTNAYEFVSNLADVPEPLPVEPWTGSFTTFAQLNGEERVVRGIGTFEETYFFRRPPGWVLDNGSQLTLHLGFSPALRPQESHITVYVNGVQVGTRRIGEGIDQEYFTFALPVQQLNESVGGVRQQVLNVRLTIVNSLATQLCEQIEPGAAWTRIYADSSFTSPHVYRTLPDLSAFPYPFVSDQPTAPTTIVLPDGQPASIGAGLSLAATLGRYAPVDYELYMMPDEAVTDEEKQNHHLLVLGQPDTNDLLSQILEDLPAIHDRDVYQALHTPDVGVLRESASPWNDERIVLLAYGQTPAGSNRATRALFNAAPPVAQLASAVVIGTDDAVRITYRGVEPSPQTEPGQVVREPLVPKPEPWLVVTVVLVLAALLVVGLIWFSRWQAERDKKGS